MCSFIRAEQLTWRSVSRLVYHSAALLLDIMGVNGGQLTFYAINRNLTYLSPGLNSRENLVFFFLCFLFRLRIDRGMLFFLLRPLCNEAVELAEDVTELVSSVSSAASSSDSSSPRRGHCAWRIVGAWSLISSSASFGTGPLLELCWPEFSSVWIWGASDCCSIKNVNNKNNVYKNKY